MENVENGADRHRPAALALLASERPRNVNWFQAAALLFGDWGTSRLYVLGLAFLVAGRTSFWLVSAMSLLILVVGWAYTHICRLYPDGGGVYTAGRRRAALLRRRPDERPRRPRRHSRAQKARRQGRVLALEQPRPLGHRRDHRDRRVQPDGPEAH